MGMFEYNDRELTEEGITRVYLVTFLEQKDTGKDTEMLIPEVYTRESMAEERIAEVEDNGKDEIYADRCTISVASEGGSNTCDMYLVLFRKHEGAKKDLASLHTPESFMSPAAALERESNINEEESRNMDAEVYPLELYSNVENFTGPKSMVAN